MSQTPTPRWVGPDRPMMIGVGDVATDDPGGGAGRYRRAGDWLASVGVEIAFASFTFDPEEPGSVLVAPEVVVDQPVAPAEPSGGPAPVVVDDGRSDWALGFAVASRSLEAGGVEKVVLARQVTVAVTAPLDPAEIFGRLVEANPSTYCFLIDGLVGASPELLVSLEDGRVRSLVLAGTAADEAGLTGPRIEVEHRLAALSAWEGLRPHTTGLVGDRSVVAVGEIRHLATTYTATALPGTGILDVLATLHPTAAVAGAPMGLALDLIREIEPRSRGRYGGPVGWFDRAGNGCFAIALRCGLVDRAGATLYAGGGLVKGADLEAEWEETEAKLRPMLQALGVERGDG